MAKKTNKKTIVVEDDGVSRITALIEAAYIVLLAAQDAQRELEQSGRNSKKDAKHIQKLFDDSLIEFISINCNLNF